MIKKIIIAALTTFFSINAMATEDVFSDNIPLVWQSIITLSGGASWGLRPSNSYLYPNPLPLYELYIPVKNDGVIGTGEILFGLQRVFYPGFTGQLGIGIAGAANAKVSGSTTVNGTPDALAYSYSIEHMRGDLKGRIIASGLRISPFVSGSFGIAMNNSHGYTVNSIDPILYPASFYTQHSTTAFAYTLGAGLQAMLNKNWQVGVGYEFADWGKSDLHADPVTGQGLGLTHFYTNSALVSLSFLY